ncbi:MAG: hypothetical protein ACOY5F_08705 [Pseudomonadota bacterium]
MAMDESPVAAGAAEAADGASIAAPASADSPTEAVRNFDAGIFDAGIEDHLHVIKNAAWATIEAENCFVRRGDTAPHASLIFVHVERYERSVPPVRFVTSAVILDASASISASVIVFSRG